MLACKASKRAALPYFWIYGELPVGSFLDCCGLYLGADG